MYKYHRLSLVQNVHKHSLEIKIFTFLFVGYIPMLMMNSLPPNQLWKHSTLITRNVTFRIWYKWSRTPCLQSIYPTFWLIFALCIYMVKIWSSWMIWNVCSLWIDQLSIRWLLNKGICSAGYMWPLSNNRKLFRSHDKPTFQVWGWNIKAFLTYDQTETKTTDKLFNYYNMLSYKSTTLF